MVLLRRKLKLTPIEEIANAFGFAVPNDLKDLFPDARHGIPHSSGYGCDPSTQVTQIFEKFGYPLIENCLFALSGGLQALKDLLTDETDVLVCFNEQALFGGEADWGHVCVIESIEGNFITLVDPAQRKPKFRIVLFESLEAAIRLHGEANRAGYWVITSSSAT